jgi:signal transduction histidine kinase
MNRAVTLRAPLRRRIFGRAAPMREGETGRVLPILLPVSGLGAAAITVATGMLVADPPSGTVLLGVLALLAASILAEAFPMPIEGVSVGGVMSLATVFIVAVAALYGWELAAVVAFLTMVTVELARRRAMLRVVYNTALYVCSGAAAGLAAEAIGNDGVWRLIMSTLAAATAFYVVDILLLAGVIARARSESFTPNARAYLYSTFPPFLIVASLTSTLVLLWEQSPFTTVVLVGPLLVIAFYQRWLHGAFERLREFDRLKDEFIAVLSHELRTPLTSVYGASLTLQQKQLDEPTRESLLAIVSTESARLARLFDDALWANRLDTGRGETVIVPTAADVLASEVVETARTRLPEELTLELEVAAGLPLVAADPDRLRQVLVNLIENAKKYSPDGGVVRVEVRPAGRYVRFLVADEGLGIPESEHGRIFEKFYRMDPNMTRGVGGTGLGLYICRELVRRMEGRIWVNSEEGHGSTFVFELPTARS